MTLRRSILAIGSSVAVALGLLFLGTGGASASRPPVVDVRGVSVVEPGNVRPGKTRGPEFRSYVLLWPTASLLPEYRVTVSGGTTTMVSGAASAATAATSATGHSIMSGGVASTGTQSEPGEIRIRIGDGCGDGCAYTRMENNVIVGADITLRTYVSNWVGVTECLIAHEVGHALGLAHVQDQRQLLYPIFTVGQSPCTYQRGDIRGLSVMGSN